MIIDIARSIFEGCDHRGPVTMYIAAQDRSPYRFLSGR